MKHAIGERRLQESICEAVFCLDRRFPEQIDERALFCPGEGVDGRLPRERIEHIGPAGLTSAGEREYLRPAIAGMRVTLHEALLLHAVEHVAGVRGLAAHSLGELHRTGELAQCERLRRGDLQGVCHAADVGVESWITVFVLAVLFSLGQGVVFTTMFATATTRTPEAEQGTASGMATAGQQLGGAIGVAVLINLTSAIDGATLTTAMTGIGLIHREVYAEVPPRVEYSLTDEGTELNEALGPLGDWGQKRLHRERLEITRPDTPQTTTTSAI